MASSSPIRSASPTKLDEPGQTLSPTGTPDDDPHADLGHGLVQNPPRFGAGRIGSPAGGA